LNLGSLSFCKASGRVNFTDTKLKQALIDPQALKKKGGMEDLEFDNFMIKN